MGKILSVVSRPLRDFNIESRAHKKISQDKLTAAPKYNSDRLTYERIIKENPDAFETSLQKDAELNQHLKDIFVTSTDPNSQPPIASSSADRPLPANRDAVFQQEFGFREPSRVPYGRVTLKNALSFIQKHQTDPIAHPEHQIAEEYKLPQETVDNILKNFRVYEIYVPTERQVKAKFVGPLVKRTQVITHKRKELPEGNRNDEKS